MQSRLLEFVTGIESSVQPDAGTPSLANDLITKGYADARYADVIEGSHSSPYSVIAGTTIPFAVGFPYIKKYIQGSAGPVTLTANPRIQAGTFEGQQIMLIGCSDTNTVSIDTGNGLIKNGLDVMVDNSITIYNWDAAQAKWVEVSRNNL